MFWQNVALFTRAWIEIDDMTFLKKDYNLSPSSRGRGLKYCLRSMSALRGQVALFTRAWIEIKRVSLTLVK